MPAATATTVRLSLFGTPSLVLPDGALRPLPLERRSQLLAFLALRREPVPRGELATLLWPEQGRAQALGNLRTALFRAQALDWAGALEIGTGALRFAAATDVQDFETALREQRGADALALARGELMAGFDDGSSEPWTRWLAGERERLHGAWRAAALAQLGGEMELGAALALSARLLEQDPLDEAALRVQLQALARDGQAGAAHAAYRAFAERLADELGLEPGAELRALRDSLLSQAGRSAQAAAGSAVAPADAGFVGRVVELQRIATLLAREDCRLLCLIGPGGVGKTRLARQALQGLAPRFADGALFVPLEDIDTPHAFAHRVLQQLGAGASGARGDALKACIDALKPRQALLVLDNFEQLAAHTALLDRLLVACPRLKLLVTSRLRLPVAGEWSMPLEGLPTPDPEDEADAGNFDAVRLFVQTAQRVQPALSPAAEAAAIVEICRRVDGLPLAIELAAAWVRVMPCAHIVEELKSGSELLRAIDGNSHPGRHASIEQVFEQSWQQLAPAEREALARLAVFRGGFTPEAARAVAGASLPVLAALADKSMLHRQASRLQLHPLVQQLALQRLDDPVLRQRTLTAHATHFMQQLLQQRRGITSGDGRTLDQVDREFENLQLAWRHAAASGEAEPLAQGMAALTAYCEHRARFDDGEALFQAVLEAPALQGDRTLRATARGHLAMLVYRQARLADAVALADQALAEARRARDPAARGVALRALAASAMAGGQLAESRRLWNEVLALARSLSQPTGPVLDNLSVVTKHLGDYEEALRLSAEALAQYRASGNHAALALGLSNRASMCLLMDDHEQAAVQLREAAQLAEREGLTSTRAYVLANLTELALKTQDWAAARTFAERALELARGAALHALDGWLRVQLARLALRRGEADAARRGLAEAAGLALTLEILSLKAAVVLGLAEWLEHQGQPAAARRVLAFAAGDLTISAANRDELRAEWVRRAGAQTEPDPAWPGLTLRELLERVQREETAGHVALLRPARR